MAEITVTPKLKAKDGTEFYSMNVLRFYEQTLLDIVQTQKDRIALHAGIDIFAH